MDVPDTDVIEPLAALLVDAVRWIIDGQDETSSLADLAGRTRDLVGAADVGILLGRDGGELQIVAATSSDIRLLELLQLRTDSGPCVEAFHSGRALVKSTGQEIAAAWPAWYQEAHHRGYACVMAAPMVHRGVPIGAVNALATEDDAFHATQLSALQAIADVATVTLVSSREHGSQRRLTDQLQGALDSRVLIEQAKGVLAERLGVNPEVAFATLRAYARNTNNKLLEVAARTVDGTLDPGSPSERR